MALLATPASASAGRMANEMASSRQREKSSATIPAPEAACAELQQSALALNLALPANLCEELYVAVEKAATRSANSMEDLRRAVELFTIALREEGAKPEVVLIALKSVINSRTFPAVVPSVAEINGHGLRQQISTWSIEEFFREKKA